MPASVRYKGMTMASARLSRLQRRILAWLLAEAPRTWWVGLLGTLTLILIALGCQPPRPWGEEYPGPWLEDSSTANFRAIVKALSVNNIRSCGEFHYRPSAYHADEYLVYCTRDGKIWVAYQVWPRIPQVTGPQPPARGVPPPYQH